MEESEGRRRRRTRVLVRRNPLSDRTNTSHNPSLPPLNPTKPNPSSSSSKPPAKRASATSVPTNLENASPNPSYPTPTLVSAPSPPKKTPSRHGTVGLEVVLSRLTSSLKRKDKENSLAFPVSSTPVPKTTGTRQQSVGVEGSIIRRTSATNAPTVLDNASLNCSSLPPPLVSAPSSPKTLSRRGTFGLEASEPIPVDYSLSKSLRNRKDKGKSVVFPVSSTPVPKAASSRQQIDGVEGSITERTSATNALTIPNNASLNPSSPPPSLFSAPSSPKTSSLRGTVGLKGSKSISVVYSRSASSSKRKGKRKSVAFPVSSTPVLKSSDSRQQSDGFEGSNLPKAKAMTVPCIKKQRYVPPKKDSFKEDPLLQDYIEKQKAYFKMIDDFELSEEEVEEVDED